MAKSTNRFIAMMALPLALALSSAAQAKPTPSSMPTPDVDAPVPVVVDSNDAVVGPYFPSVNGGPVVWNIQDAVLLTLNTFPLLVPVTSSGFLKTGTTFSYTTSDC